MNTVWIEYHLLRSLCKVYSLRSLNKCDATNVFLSQWSMNDLTAVEKYNISYLFGGIEWDIIHCALKNRLHFWLVAAMIYWCQGRMEYDQINICLLYENNCIPSVSILQ